MRILLWHVHGSWTTSFVQGAHEYLLPVVPDRGPDGRGRAQTWDWPASAIEVTRPHTCDAYSLAIAPSRAMSWPASLRRVALYTMSRAASSSVAMSASSNWTCWNSASAWPNWRRSRT